MKENTILLGPPLGGVRHDLPTTMIPAGYASRLLNVSTSGKALTKRAGKTVLGTNLPLGSPVIGFEQYRMFNGDVITVLMSGDDVYRLTGTYAWESIKDANTWAPQSYNLVSCAVMMNTLIFTNGVDPIRSWNGTDNTVAKLANADNYVCKKLVPFRDRLLLLNMIESGVSVPQRVRWTKIGTYNNFTDGGFVDLVDSPESIQNGIKLGPDLAIYKRDSIIMSSYLGGRSVFSFDTRVSTKGLAAAEAVVDMGSYHLFMDTDNIYMFDGGRAPQPVGDPIKDYLYEVIRPDGMDNVFARRYGDYAWFFVPTQGTYPDMVFIFDGKEKEWTYGTADATMGGYYVDTTTVTIGDLVGNIGDLVGSIGDLGNAASIRPNIAVGDEAGNVYFYNNMYLNDAGSVIAAMWETGDIQVVIEGRYVTNRSRAVFIDAKGNSIDVEYSLDEGETWNDLGTVSLGSKYKFYKVDFDITWDKIRFRFSNSTYSSTFWLRQITFAYLEDIIRC